MGVGKGAARDVPVTRPFFYFQNPYDIWEGKIEWLLSVFG